MRVGLVDVDGSNFPNLPLMKLSAWHKSRGDQVEWYNPMFSGHMDKVYVSKLFSFSPDYMDCIDADEIIFGGSGYCIENINGKEIYHPERDIHLPKEAARIWLRVTDVRAERLQDMTIEDCEKEGVLCGNNGDIFSYMEMWDSALKKADREKYGWATNPWVWVVEFERCEKPD